MSDLISVLVALNWSGFVLVIVLFSKKRKFNSRSNGTFVGLKQMLELPAAVQGSTASLAPGKFPKCPHFCYCNKFIRNQEIHSKSIYGTDRMGE